MLLLQDIAVIIPAYCPDEKLTALVGDLKESGFRSIVVVDDGSGASYAGLFDSLGVIVRHHATNLGKGAALKTGIDYAIKEFPGLLGVVTADADGQHLPADIRNVAARFAAEPESLVLGSRVFHRKVPLRSRAGNFVTRQLVRVLVGEKLNDTQTGLRAIPSRFAASLLDLKTSGYGFELDMLIAARQARVQIEEVSVEAVYEPGNKSSHFNPFLDSMKVYLVLVRFSSVGLSTAFLDNLVFYLTYRQSKSLIGAQAAGRLIALLFNYAIVRRQVFRSKEGHDAAFPKYLVLVFISASISYGCIRLAVYEGHIPVLAAKLTVEGLLFFFNFAAQRHWVFAKSRQPDAVA